MDVATAHGRWPLARLRSAKTRLVLYAATATLLFVLAVAAVSFKKDFDLVVSDARCYYVYLPSLVIDGDLDFSNQIREHRGGDCTRPSNGTAPRRAWSRTSTPSAWP